MPSTREDTAPAPAADWLENLYRKTALKLLTALPEGSFELYEQGHLLLSHGARGAAPHAVIEVHRPGFYRRMLKGGSIGAAESFIDGEWSSPELTDVIRLVARNLAWLDRLEARMAWLTWTLHQWQHRMRGNTRGQARQNILAHYDLGNDLYRLFLDPEMLYSSGLFLQPDDSLEQAQINKMQRLCEKLQLKPTDHLLEIGTGWGAMAIYAARNFGCRVTTTTISDAQFDYARARIEAAGLGDRITLLKQDYRDLTGSYDKLVSVEMIEAVGRKFLPQFFAKCDSLLKPDGILALQAITIADQRLEYYARNVDFIQKHIFPGGFLPSVTLLGDSIRQHSSMVIRHLDDMGLDYART
ncbi:MAG: class I SAM-dependent methyltransferase, partial [Methylobacterium sp.]|nr:class I SAM-dependent methyltransferase [Methylobacterium sp.]